MDSESMASTPLPLDAEMEVEAPIDYSEQDGDIVIDEADAEMVFEATREEGMLEEAEMDDAVVWGEPDEEIMTEEVLGEESAVDIAPLESAFVVEEPATIIPIEEIAAEATEAFVEPETFPAATQEIHDDSAVLPLPTVDANDAAAVISNEVEPLVEAANEEVEIPSNASVKGKGRADEFFSNGTTSQCSCSASVPLSRPELKKAMLDLVEFDKNDSATLSSAIPSTSTSAVPSIYVTHNNGSYSLFQRYVGDLETDRATSEARPLLFGGTDEQDLYYASVEKLIEAIHGVLPDFRRSAVELVLTFPEIGISLTEDSIYTRQVSLYDFYRTHVGCGLTGSLSLALEVQPRFANDFNSLMDHIEHQRLHPASAEPVSAAGEEPLEEAPEVMAEVFENEVIDEVEVQLADDEQSVLGDDQEVRSETYEVIDGATGADEEGEVYEAEEEWGHEELEAPNGEGGLDQASYELEEVLAEMDSDDLAALVDGAIEDVSAFSESDQLAMLEEMRADGENLDSVVGEEIGGDENVGIGEGAGDDGLEGGKSEGVVESAVELDDTVVTDDTATVEVENGTDSAESFVVVDSEDTPVAAVAHPVAELSVADSLPLKSLPTVPSYNFSYDSPAGTGREPPSIPPLSSEAIVDAAKENATHATSHPEFESDTVNVASLPLSETTPALVDSDDVVIDYEEPFEAASELPTVLSVDTTAPIVDAALQSVDEPAAMRSPKRSRTEADLPLLDESSTVDPKRPRLAEPVPIL